jgi:hypothetical protein
MFDLTTSEMKILRRLTTPSKIQDFIETIPANFEMDGETCLSPRRVLRERRAHCIEGAMLAALALRIQGSKPLVLDLTAAKHDQDHVIAIFQKNHKWGAISKSNHAVLRYRDPVYRTIRELVASYFHEYTDDRGNKTLRTYTRPIDLSRFDRYNWMSSEKDVWIIPNALADARHIPLLTPSLVRQLRSADPIERKAGTLLRWKHPR